jgi:hypothetical protein
VLYAYMRALAGHHAAHTPGLTRGRQWLLNEATARLVADQAREVHP